MILKHSYTYICTAVVLLICFAVTASARKGYGPGEQDWGYVDVRTGAHMFYWLYYTTANVTKYTERPLAIWLQGGPGAPSTGYGNFEELGPLDVYGNYRNHTWVKDMNVLFIDNPVGTGFSYVDLPKYLTTNNKQIAKDLVTLMKGFYKKHPEFQTVPLHIFCESYGGKMSPEFALELYNAIKRGEIKSNLTSVSLGDPWTSPMDSMWAWAPLLLHTGVVDQNGYERIMNETRKTEELVQAGKWAQATTQWGYTENVILQVTKGVDFYNIAKPTGSNAVKRLLGRSLSETMYRTLVEFDLRESSEQMLTNLMRGEVSRALNIPRKVRFGSQGSLTFTYLRPDFMKPVIHIVSQLLDKTDLQVSVFSGQFDLICATAGAVNWVDKMQWSYKSAFEAAPRTSISVNGILEGYERSVRKFSFFWINRAGHMVPADNPAGMSHILRKMTKFG